MCTLLAFVDDATSRLMRLRFVASESAFDYFRATKDYLDRASLLLILSNRRKSRQNGYGTVRTVAM